MAGIPTKRRGRKTNEEEPAMILEAMVVGVSGVRPTVTRGHVGGKNGREGGPSSGGMAVTTVGGHDPNRHFWEELSTNGMIVMGNFDRKCSCATSYLSTVTVCLAATYQ